MKDLKRRKNKAPSLHGSSKRVKVSFHSFIESLVVPECASFALKFLKYEIRHKLMLEKVCKFW